MGGRSVTLPGRDTCPGVSPRVLHPGQDPVGHKAGAFPLSSTILTPRPDAHTSLPRTHRASRRLTQNQNRPRPWPPSPPLDLLTSSPTTPATSHPPPTSRPGLTAFAGTLSLGYLQSSSLRGPQLHLLTGTCQVDLLSNDTCLCPVPLPSLPCELRGDGVLEA